MKTRILLLMTAVLWSFSSCGQTGENGESPFVGMWKSEGAHDLYLYPDTVEGHGYYGSWGEDGMDAVYYKFDEIVSQTPNQIVFSNSESPDLSFTVTYDPDKRTINFKAMRDGKVLESEYNGPIDMTYRNETEKLDYVYVMEPTNVMTSAENGTVKAKAGVGDRFKFTGKGGGNGCEVYLPDNSRGWLNDNYTFGPREPFKRSSFPEGWQTSKEYMSSDGHEIVQGYNLSITMLPDNRVLVIDEWMAPIRLPDAQMVGMATDDSYLGKIDGNRIILYKSKSGYASEDDGFDDFEDMENPEEIICIPNTYTQSYRMIYDGRTYSIADMYY